MVDETSDISDKVDFFFACILFFLILFIKNAKNSPNPNLQMTGMMDNLLSVEKQRQISKKKL